MRIGRLKRGEAPVTLSGCVLYLPLGKLDGSPFMSRDAYGHLCTVTGALWTPEGRSFDGTDDYVEIPDVPGLDITTTVTVEAWVKKTANAGSYPHLVSKWDTKRNYSLYVSGTTTVRFGVGNGVASADTPTHTPTNGVWYHYVGTYDGSKVNLYVDGVLFSNVAYTSGLAAAVNKLYLGRHSGDPVTYGYFKGLIALVRIYNRALSALEVQRSYQAGRT